MSAPKKPKASRKALGKKLSHEPLHELIEKARAIKMTPEQEKAQRLSFAYGNLAIDNPSITREMVAAADSLPAGWQHRGYDQSGYALFVWMDA